MRRLLTLLVVLGMSCLSVSAQTLLKGKVLAKDGKPIPSASVLIKGTSRGVATASDGTFTVNIPQGKKEIVVSAIGYEPTDVKLDGTTDITVVLAVSEVTLSEIVVSGVAAATSRKQLTVSVTKIGEDRLSATPALSMSSALSGKVAGVRSSSGSGAPGGSTDILLRADNNLNLVGSGPLILLDGVILNGNISDINVDDVESMEVVKGAAASSLYGSRAGNGVISIITKKGSKLAANTTKVTIRNEVGFQSIAKKLELATHHPYKLATDWQQYQGQYTKYAGVTYPNGYIGAGYNPGIAGNRAIDDDHFLDNPFGVTRNQQDEFFKTGVNYTNFVGVSSRSGKTSIYTSFENNSQEGIIQFTQGYKRQNYRFNLEHEIAPWLKLTTSNLYINTTYKYPGNGAGTFFNIVLAEPDADLKAPNPDGQPYYLRINQFNGETTNPLYNLSKQQRDDKTRRWIGSYGANAKFTSWANLDVLQTLEIENYRYTSYYPKDYWTPTGGTAATNGMSYTNGSMEKFSSETKTANTQVTLNLAEKFGDLSVRGRLSYLYENRYYEDYRTSASRFVYKDVPRFYNFSSITSSDSKIEEEKAQNYFVALGLGWKEKILFDGMYRYDGSSLFGPDARWNSYYRLSGAYRISQDVRIPGIDELKVRAAYGTAGIRPQFGWIYERYTFSGLGQAEAEWKSNPLLKPSKTAETEVGLNVDFLRKFSFEAVYARSTTSDQFIQQKRPPFVNQGFKGQYVNGGTVKSNTLELSLGARWITQKDFSWNSNVVFSRIRQRITDLPVPPYLFGSTDGGGNQMFYVRSNEQYGAMYGYDWVRTLDQMAKQLPSGKAIGDYVVNSDGYVIEKGTEGTANEKAVVLKDEQGNNWYGKIGDGNAKFNLGIANTLTYKGISLYFLFDVKNGGDIYNAKGQWITRDYRNKIMDMSGVPDGQKKTYDYYINFYNTNIINKYWVEKGSYVKLRELAIGYSFSRNLLDKAFKGVVKGVSAKVIGRNLWTITDYTGYDPEVGSLREPYDGTYKYPNFRNIAFSLAFDF